MSEWGVFAEGQIFGAVCDDRDDDAVQAIQELTTTELARLLFVTDMLATYCTRERNRRTRGEK